MSADDGEREEVRRAGGDEPAGTGPADGAQAGAGLKPWLSLRNWRVRSRLVLLVTMPTLAALVLGGVSVASSIGSAVAYQRVQQLASLASKVTGLVQALQSEREETIRYITLGPAGGRGSTRAAAAPELSVLHQDYRQTDQLASQVRSLAATIDGSYPTLAQQEARGAVTAIEGLAPLRTAATTTKLPPLVVIEQYAGTVDELLALENEIAVGSNDATLADSVRAASLISSVKEDASQEQAILTSALAPDLIGASKFTHGQLSAIQAAQAEQQANISQFGLTATASQRQVYNAAISSTQADRAQAQVEEAIALATSGGSTTDNPAFTDAASGSSYLVASLRSVEQTFMDSVTSQSASLRDQAITSAVAYGLAVVLVLVIALLLTALVGRSMVRPLRRLRAGALEVAGVRLPETVRRMSEADGAGLPIDIEPIDVDSSDEIGEVARAFDQVHREALRLAANEAALRGNVNAMFVNLSRRSQSLVERQISLIDELEQSEQDAERLGNLFSLDHLATRMRRNSENLLVLAGHDLTRRWTESVTLMDVLRAAVSEIEQYERVTLNVQPGIAVRGHAVNDVVHLLAELVENATSFSAADTPVNVSGHLLNSGGVLLDITDQGVGMVSEEMAHANWRLDNPPVVDVAVSRRMGLFVVARLAARHGIRVRLRTASLGGLTSLVWLPDEVVSVESAGAPVGSRPSRGRAVEAGAGTGALSFGDWPPVAGSADRAAAVEAVTAARAPRFSPSSGEVSDTTAFPVLDTDKGRDAEAPAFGFADMPDLDAGTAAPASATGPMPVFGAPVRTDNHWLSDVLGADDAASSRGGSYELARPGAFDQARPGAFDQARPGVIVPPPAGPAEENRLPIFESVESDWFRRGRHGADRPLHSGAAVGEAGWDSPADEGWRAAEAVQAPVAGGLTISGLPKRVPRANLVPGSAGGSFGVAQASSARTAAETRERLASFQRGIRQGRAAARDVRPSNGEGGGGGAT